MKSDQERKPVVLHLTAAERTVLANVAFHDESIGQLVERGEFSDRRSDSADVEHVLELVRRAVVRTNTKKPETEWPNLDAKAPPLVIDSDSRWWS